MDSAAKSRIPKRDFINPNYKLSAIPTPQIGSSASSTESGPKSLNFRAIVGTSAAPGPPAARAAYLRRRSKSVTDLRPAKQIKSNFTQTLAKLRQATAPLASIENNNKTAAKKPESRANKTAPGSSKYGQKRPIVNQSGEEKTAGTSSGAPTQPKRARIPDWDYKSKFNDLLGRHNIVKEDLKSKNERLNALADIETEHDRLKEENAEIPRFRQEIASLKKELQRLSSVERQLSDLTAKHDHLLADHQVQTKTLTDLEHKHERLSVDHANLKEKYRETCAQMQADIDKLNRDLQDQHTLRRVLHNTIQDLKGNIRVFCRVRPPINGEERDRLLCNINVPNETTLELRKMRESISTTSGRPTDVKQEFVFDRVFAETTTQEEVFEELHQLVQSALDGYNVCVFAYGQTGSGKTYTMQGGDNPKDFGMIPRTIDFIFDTIAKLERNNWRYKVEASFLEIYNENIRDLLQKNTTTNHSSSSSSSSNGGITHELRYNDGQNVTVTNLKISPISSAQELKDLMASAQRNRAVAQTNFNLHSSRSHAVTKIGLRGQNLTDSRLCYEGSIHLVDLAGSESAKTSERLAETKSINKSLSTLGNVLLALYNKDSHIPYRDSKLTYLLQSSLGGNSKTLMFVNIAPFEECYGESVNSLRFASKVKEVKLVSKRNRAIAMSVNK